MPPRVTIVRGSRQHRNRHPGVASPSGADLPSHGGAEEVACAYSLGEWYYRLGRAEDACEHFRAALAIRLRLNEPAEEILATELACAMAAFRAGLLDEAEAVFEGLRANPLLATAAGQAETLGALAMVAARRGESRRAEERISAALRKAGESGEPDVRVNVARSAGETYLLLDRPQDSRRAFAEALETAQAVNASRNGPEIPPEDLLGVLVGLAESGDDDPRRILEALRLLPKALDDANAWWDLPRLIPRAALLAERGLLAPGRAEAGQLRLGMQRMVEAGVQRPDCRKAVVDLVLALSTGAGDAAAQ